MSAEKQVEKEIREAIFFLKEKNHTEYCLLCISNETIEFMKQASLEKLKNINKDEPKQARGNSQSRLTCFHYDYAQGRHHCTNPIVKANKCNGVCKDYKDKNIMKVNVEKHSTTDKSFTITTPHLNIKVDYDDVNHCEVDAAIETLQIILEKFWNEEFFLNVKKKVIMKVWHKNENHLQQLYEEEGGLEGFKRDNGI